MTATFIRSARALHRNNGPNVVAMAAGEGQVHVLQGPAAVIWDILEHGAAIVDIVDQVARLYERPNGEVRGPVEDCVRDLVQRELVEERRA